MTLALVATLFVVLAPMIGLAVCFVAHVAVSRRAPALPHQHGLLVSVAAGAAVVVALLAPVVRDDLTRVSAADAVGALVAALAAYVLLAYCYVIGFFNIGESARRIRLLIELEAAGTRGLTVPEVLTAYNARMIVDARLERLLSGGQIAEVNGRYVLRSRVMLWAAKALVVVKIVLLRRRIEVQRAETL
jgi:hypothetical protein